MTDITEIADDVASRCAAVRTLSTARAVTRHYDDALRPVKLTITQFTLMVTIAKTSPESISQVADQLSMDRTSVSRNLALLEKNGLIERGSQAAARKRPVSLSRAGEARLQQAYKLWNGAQSQIEKQLSRRTFGNAMRAMKDLRKAV